MFEPFSRLLLSRSSRSQQFPCRSFQPSCPTPNDVKLVQSFTFSFFLTSIFRPSLSFHSSGGVLMARSRSYMDMFFGTAPVFFQPQRKVEPTRASSAFLSSPGLLGLKSFLFLAPPLAFLLEPDRRLPLFYFSPHHINRFLSLFFLSSLFRRLLLNLNFTMGLPSHYSIWMGYPLPPPL